MIAPAGGTSATLGGASTAAFRPIGGYPRNFRGGFEEEDRSRDWYCAGCRERNFVKRSNCHKCNASKPADGGCGPKLEHGTTMQGMVKTYNSKGFGFLMILGVGENAPDLYYTRDSVSPKLEIRNIPGQHVTFEVHKAPGGRVTAINIRPVGDPKPGPNGFARPLGPFPRPPGTTAPRPLFPFAAAAAVPTAGVGGFSGGYTEEDRSRDWICSSCGQRNFVKRLECFKCNAPRGNSEAAEPPPRAPTATRNLSPHAGSRAYRESLIAGRVKRSRSRSKSSRRKNSRRRKKRRDDSSSSAKSSSSGSSQSSRKAKGGKKKKRRKKKAKNKRADSSGSSKSSRSSTSRSSNSDGARAAGADAAAAGAAAAQFVTANNEVTKAIEQAKAQALEEMLKLRDVQPKEKRMADFRAMLRKWHPDKNPERVDVATAVFQFLQKGKTMLEAG